MDIDMDTAQLRTLAADLGRLPDEAVKKVRATTRRAALNIKRDLQREAENSGHFSRVPMSISYDTRDTPDGIVAEIGPESGNPRGHPRAQGSLAWIPYEGTATMGPLFPDPLGALLREAEPYETYLAAAIADDPL